MTQVHTHSCQIQVLQLLAPGMNVYGAVSPFILQDLAQGTMCTQAFLPARVVISGVFGVLTGLLLLRISNRIV